MDDTIFAQFSESIDQLFDVFDGDGIIHPIRVIFHQAFEGAISGQFLKNVNIIGGLMHL